MNTQRATQLEVRSRGPSVRRLSLNGFAALLIVLAFAATTGVALAQSSRAYGLGCWSITSAGSTAGLYSSASYRLKYAVTHIAPTDTQVAPASANFRLRSNHFAARALATPPGKAVTPPPAGHTLFTYLPLAWGRIVNLAALNVCR